MRPLTGVIQLRYSDDGGAIAPDSFVCFDSAEYFLTAAKKGRAAGGVGT